MALFPEMYSAMYCIKKLPLAYESTTSRLEEELRLWREQMPPELSDPSHESQETRVSALYLKYWDLEFRLFLHHRTVCSSTDPQVMTSNEARSLEAATNMLLVARQLQYWKSLDVSWVAVTVCLAAMFATLFVQNRRAQQVTPTDMDKLRSGMELWLDILGDVGIALRE